MQVDRETVIALAAEHAICTSVDSKEFDHDGLIRFAQAIARRAAEAERARCAAMAKAFKDRGYDYTGDLELHEAIASGFDSGTKAPDRSRQPTQTSSHFTQAYWRDRDGMSDL